MSNPFVGERARRYDFFFKTPFGREVLSLEWELIKESLKELKGKGLLEVGCGTGMWLELLKREGFGEQTGIDVSKDMIKVAKEKGLRKLVIGDGKELPFKDNSFTGTLFITSLEFIKDKGKALIEAARVSRESVIVGFLNGNSLLNAVRRLKGLFRESSYSEADFLTYEKLKKILKFVREKSPYSLKVIDFKTTLNLTFDGFILPKVERKLGSSLPFGGFAVAKLKVIKKDGAGKGNRG
ncbi:class I SAM-dependent methyltransferase [Thermovibrio sp.]